MISLLVISIVSARQFEFPILSLSQNDQPNSNLLKKESFLKEPITNSLNYAYYVSLEIGSPPQAINLGLNTYDSLTFVPLINCDCEAANTRYTPSLSSTFVNLTNIISRNSFYYQISGYAANETFSVQNLTINNTEFIAITYGRKLYPLDGYFGLGFCDSANRNKKGIIQHMKSVGLIDRAIFSVYLNHDLNTLKKSMLTIGSWNPAEYSTGFSISLPMSAQYCGWQIDGMNVIISIENEDINNERLAISFDLHSSFIYLKKSVYNLFISKLQKVVSLCKEDRFQNFYCECSLENYDNFPIFSVKINGNNFMIHSVNYLQYVPGFKNICKLLIVPFDYNEISFGIPFFREYYTMFDLEKKELHIAKAIASTENIEFFYPSVIRSGLVVGSIFLISIGIYFSTHTAKKEGIYERVY